MTDPFPPGDQPSDDPPGSWRQRVPGGRRTLAAVALAVLVLVAVVAVLVIGEDDEPERADLPLPEAPVEISASIQELIALLVESRAVSPIHLRYEAIGAPPDDAGADAPGEPVLIEVWRRGDRLRVDTVTSGADGAARTAAFDGPDGSVSCRRPADGSEDPPSDPTEEGWRCGPGDAPASPDELADQVLADLSGVELSARDETIDGRSGRCFSWAGEDGGEICVDDDGVLLRLVRGEVVLRLVERTGSVNAQILEPPTA